MMLQWLLLYVSWVLICLDISVGEIPLCGIAKFLLKNVPHQQHTRVAVTLHLHQKWALWICGLCQINTQRISHYLIFIILIIRKIKRFKQLISLVNYIFMSFAHFSIIGICRLHWFIRSLLCIWDFKSVAWLFLNITWSGGFWPSRLMMAGVTHQRDITLDSHVIFIIK